MSGWATPAIAAGIPAAGALVAAVVAARSAARTKAAELQATRVLEPERRRAEVFESLIEAFDQMWQITRSGKASNPAAFERGPLPVIQRFMHWVQMYGSDEAVVASHQFMQAIYHEPPPNVLMRLMGDLIVVARRELGYPETNIGPVEVLGMWITDIYTDAQIYSDMTDPLDRVFARHKWTPPWPTAPSRRR
jgi:hypothetical protein